MPNRIIPYRPDLREKAKQLRNKSTLAEVLLWEEIKNRKLGYQFHRQVPLLNYIVDFYSHELQLAIEVDGDSHNYNFDYDQQRSQELVAYGIRVLRIDDLEVKKQNQTEVQAILNWIDEHQQK
ncbi:endonuclease domain-containing protein [Rufibacter roseolus]|uniref:endonuclease domain-containing protein n=1 Tax=Rufibacter roseolus TaxID=2817375 RepID=UPI001B310054|nr:endonuclease domain-containing protein [Rufibacter roseolus]